MKPGLSGRHRSLRSPKRLLFFAVLLVLMVIAIRVVLWRPLPVMGEAPRDGYTRISGSIHIHTTYSDGGGTPQDVAAAARAEGLDYAIITDHNNADAKDFEGYHDGVLMLVGTEVSTDAGHLLGLGIDRPPFRFSGGVRDGLDDVRLLRGVPIAAHPLRAGGNEESVWRGWDEPGPWGFEIINGKSQWLAASVWGHLRTYAAYPFNSRYALLSMASAPREELARWDEMLKERQVTGTFGADAHSNIPLWKGKSVRFPSYRLLLGTIRDHIVLNEPLSGEIARDKAAILDAIERGRVYIGVDGMASAKDFSFVAASRERTRTMGDAASPTPDLTLRVAGRFPRGVRIMLLRDGRIAKESAGPFDLEAPAPGIYRVEAYVPGWEIPWIISNPIYVIDEEQARIRAARAAWPEWSEASPPTTIIDGFDGASVFTAEFDASSLMRFAFVGPGKSARSMGAARVDFRLAASSAGQPYTWCALVNRAPRDFRQASGLVLSVKAKGVYRVWVQVRDENPASADEGTEWWFASLRTSTAWRRIALPFDSFRSVNPKTDGKLDLDRVRAIAFIIDRGAMPEGAQGTIFFDELGIY